MQRVSECTLQARRKLAEVLSAVEFLDTDCMDIATTHLPGVVNPLAGQEQQPQQQEPGAEPQAGQAFYMLIETHGSDVGHDQAKLDAFLEVRVPGHLCCMHDACCTILHACGRTMQRWDASNNNTVLTVPLTKGTVRALVWT